MRRLCMRGGALGIVAVFTWLLAVPAADSQSLYGTLVGAVRDPSGAALPGVTVTATHVGTQLVRTAVSDGSGAFTIPNLPPGEYMVSATLEGFREFVRTGVRLDAGAVSRVDVPLEIGQLSETVTVATDAAVLQTDQAVTRAEISERDVVDLPLPDFRNYQSLLDLVPGTTPAEFQNTEITTPARSLATVVSGTNKNNNSTRVDGATNRYTWLPHHALFVPPAETIETVTITTSAFEADQGMAGGAAIQVITKSGTNDLSGSAFYSHNTNHLNARSWSSKRNDLPEHDTRFVNGALAVGGPIARDRLFFFAAWDGTFRDEQQEALWSVPTAAVRAGDFSRAIPDGGGQMQVIYDPATGRPDGTGRQPFAGNGIPADRLDATALRLQELFPEPNRAGETQNYVHPYTTHFRRNIFDAKVNWNASPTQLWWAKLGVMDADVANLVHLGVDGVGSGEMRTYVGTIAQTWTLSPTTVMDTTLGYSRLDLATFPPDYGTHYGLDVLGIPGTNGPDVRQSGYPSFLTGYTALGNNQNVFPSFYDDPSWTFSSNLSRLAGAHTIQAGIQYDRFAMNHWQPEVGAGPRGRFEFGGGITSVPGADQAANYYNQYAAFLLGLTSAASKSLQWEEMSTRESYVAAYVSDRWQMTERTTLTAGLRWEYYPLVQRRDRGLEILDLATMRIGLGGRGDTPANVGIEPSRTLFAPSAGLAHRLSDRDVLRGGYRLSYNPLPFGRPLRGAFPLTIAAAFVGPDNFQPFGRLADGIPAFTGPSLEDEVPLPAEVEMRTPDPTNLDRSRLHSWNVSYERRLPFDMLVDIAYVGTATRGGYADLELNWSPPGGGNTGRQFYEAFGRTASTRLWGAITRTNYHGLQMSWSRPFRDGLMLRGAYTWSKSMNMTDEDGWAGLPYNSPDQFDRNYARAGFDRTHNVQLAWAYELPFGRAGSGALSRVVRDWQVNGVVSAVSGTPMTVGSSATSLNAAGDQQTADQVGEPQRTPGFSGRAGEPYYDPSAWQEVSEQRFGTSGRNSVRGPGYWNLNLSLFRSFELGAASRLQFRAEAFHITNHPQWANPNLSVSGANFMEITNASGARSIRLSARVSF